MQNCLDVRNEVLEKKLHFLLCLFHVGDRETEKVKKIKMEKGPKTYKKSVLLRCPFKNGKNEKIDFCLQKLPDTICVRKGEKRTCSCTLSVLAKTFLGPKQ